MDSLYGVMENCTVYGMDATLRKRMDATRRHRSTLSTSIVGRRPALAAAGAGVRDGGSITDDTEKTLEKTQPPRVIPTWGTM